MSRSAWAVGAVGLCGACGAAEPLVEGPPDPAWTEAELDAAIKRYTDMRSSFSTNKNLCRKLDVQLVVLRDLKRRFP